MDFLNIEWTIPVTAFLSSALTLFFAYLLYKLRLKRKLKLELEEFAGILKERLREGVEEAGKELLPKFRNEVSEGFKDALSSALAGELIEETAKRVAKGGTNFVETGINLLLGKKPQE